MEILKAKVYHNRIYANPPTLQLLVDKVYHVEDFVFSKKELSNNRTAYFAEKDGEIDFFLHDPRNEQGYGGRVFTIILDTGETVKVKGPWSSRPSFMGPLFDIECMEVSITDDPKAFDRGYTFMAGHITIEAAKKAILPDNYRLVCKAKYSDNEPVWSLKKLYSIIEEIQGNDPSYNPLTTALVKSKIDRDIWKAACSRVYYDGYYGPVSDEEWREQDGREPSNVKEAIKVIANVLEEVDDYKFENEYGYFEIADASLIRAELVPFYKEIYGVSYPSL